MVTPSFPLFASRLMRLSLESPLVSAFYKLIAFFFIVARKADFFGVGEGVEDGAGIDEKSDFLRFCRQYVRLAAKKVKGRSY